MTRVIAVTGATGYVGRFVVAALQREGLTVRALTRQQSDPGGFDGPVTWVRGGLLDADALAVLVDGAEAVIHLAYEHVPGRYRGGEGDNLGAWIEANVGGSLRLLLAAQAAGAEKFIFLSSRAVFSRTEPGRELDETHPTSPDTHYGAYKVAVEAFLSSTASVSRIRTYAIRATGVYGMTWPVERSKWWGLVNAVLQGETPAAARGGTEVHGEDVARVVWEIVRQPDVRPGAFHLSDLYVTERDLVQMIRRLAGIPGPLPPAPAAPPVNVLVSHRLAELGVTLGGPPLLERTLAQLIEAARKQFSA